MGKHRLDALTDGIFAVAMTLLVIDLKIPEALHAQPGAHLGHALIALIPKFISWVISFLVLSFFWWGHHRAFHFVHRVDGRLAFYNLLFLGAASLMPFASALSGEYTGRIAAQVVYSLTMSAAALLALLLWRYVYRHPELCDPPLPLSNYRGARLRTLMLVGVSVIAVVLALWIPGSGNAAFMLMAFAGPLARRVERAA